jgi:hypothetical protein
MQHLLNRKYYKGDLTQEEVNEDVIARLAYLQYMQKFSQDYTVRIRGTPVPVMSIVDNAAIIFAAGVVRLKAGVHEKVPEVEGCDFERFRDEMSEFIEEDFPAFTDNYKSLLHKDVAFLWTHPEITIHRGVSRNLEDVEFLRGVMFAGVDADQDLDSDDEEGPPSKRLAEGTFYFHCSIPLLELFLACAGDDHEDLASRVKRRRT